SAQGEPNGHVGFQDALDEEPARLAQARAVVGEEGAVHQSVDGHPRGHRLRGDSGPLGNARRSRHQLLPTIGMSVPVIAHAASDGRNASSAAMDSGLTHLEKSAFGMAARFVAVSMTLGAIAFTVTPSSRSSLASDPTRA